MMIAPAARSRAATVPSWSDLIEAPRVRGAAEDRVGALIVGEKRCDVGMTDDDRAGGAQSRGDRAVLVRSDRGATGSRCGRRSRWRFDSRRETVRRWYDR